MPNIYFSHQPLLNHQSKIMAIRFSLHSENALTPDRAVNALLPLLGNWLYGKRMTFLDFGAISFDARLFDWPIPGNTVIEVPSSALLGPQNAPLVEKLLSLPVSLALIYDENAPEVLATGIRFRFINFDAKRYTPEQIKKLAAQMLPHGLGVAFNVPDYAGFQAYMSAGLNAVSSWFFKHPDKAKKAKVLNPAQANILHVLNLVRGNADIGEIEEALKQDVAISYKLLRYINSSGFCLSCEIQSFHHAVTILGYEKLNKWLSLLLATASKDPMAMALMHTALTRARLMELLAHELINPQEYDNLFITGAFSLLDALFGVDMDVALESMSLPTSINDALLGNQGIYSPFLNLVKASEGDDGSAIASQAKMLDLTPQQFNTMQLQALAFADMMDF